MRQEDFNDMLDKHPSPEARIKYEEQIGGILPPSPPAGGVAAPGGRERPALIGDQVDADIARLRSIAVGPWVSENESTRQMAEWYLACANRYEIIAGAYFATWERKQHSVDRAADSGVKDEQRA